MIRMWARWCHGEGHETLHDICRRAWESQQSQYCVASALVNSAAKGENLMGVDDPHSWHLDVVGQMDEKLLKIFKTDSTRAHFLLSSLSSCVAWLTFHDRYDDGQDWRYVSARWTKNIEERYLKRMKRRSRLCHKLWRDERRLCASHPDRALT